MRIRGSQSELNGVVARSDARQQLAHWLVASGCLLLLTGFLYGPRLPIHLTRLVNWWAWIALAVVGLILWLEGASSLLSVVLLMTAVLGAIVTLSRSRLAKAVDSSEFDVDSSVVPPAQSLT